jgi:hypothetical protein
VLRARGADGVKVKIVLVASWVIIPATPGETVKVVALMVEGFIALLKVIVTTVLGQTPAAPLRGTTEAALGGVTVGLVPVLSGSLHPAAIMSSRNAVQQSVRFLYVDIPSSFFLSAQLPPHGETHRMLRRI